VKQVPAEEQYYSMVHSEGAVQVAPGMVQILVTGQQACPMAHALASVRQETSGLEGSKHFLASGQQYSLVAHTRVPTAPLTPVTGKEGVLLTPQIP